MREDSDLKEGAITVSEAVCEDIAKLDTVLVVSQGGVRSWCFTSTRDKGVSRRFDSRRDFGSQIVQLVFDLLSEALSDVVILLRIGLSSWQIHCAASRDSLSASAASENFFEVLAVATDLDVAVHVQGTK